MTYEERDDSGRLWRWHNRKFASYCYLMEPGTPVHSTEELGRGVNVDRDADGNVVGIEFI